MLKDIRYGEHKGGFAMIDLRTPANPMPMQKLLELSGADRFRRIERRFLRTLIIGFGLVLVAMFASGLIGLRAMNRIGAGTQELSGYYLRESSQLDDLLRHQANLGVLLYSIAKERPGAGIEHLRPLFAQQRERILTTIHQATQQRPHPIELAAWQDVEQKAISLFDEADRLLSTHRNDSGELSILHRGLIASIAKLVEVSQSETATSSMEQLRASASTVSYASILFLAALAMSLLCAVGCIFGSVALFQRLETHANTLSRLSMHTLLQQEEAARRFSQDMHDEFGQALNAIEATLTVVRPKDEESQERVQDALALVKEAQSMAREMSHLLRPRILDDFGLDAGLRELARGYSKRTGIVVDYRSNTRERLDADVETQLFRIAQEALTNTSRHTMATMANISLDRSQDCVTLTVSDNGGGFPTPAEKTTPDSGLGLLGMQERVRAVGGRLFIESKPQQGVQVRAEVPVTTPLSEVSA